MGTPAVDVFPVALWSRLVNRRLRTVTSAQLDYGDTAGLRALREAIADHVQTARGTRCRAEQVMIVAGAQQGFELVCRLLLDPGDRVWMEEPGYPGARSALRAAGARIVPVPVDAEGLDVDTGPARRRRAPRLCTPSHQYPLGVPMSLTRRLALLDWARAAKAWVIEDDYDSEFRYGARPIPCLHGLDVDGRVIYVGSFSKTLFPALRLGFVIVPTDLRERLVAARAAADQHPPTLDQAVLADFIVEGHFARHLRRMRVVYQERLQALTASADVSAAGSCACGRSGPVSTRSPTSTASTPSASRGRRPRAGWRRRRLSGYFAGRAGVVNGLVLGFGAVRPGRGEAWHGTAGVGDRGGPSWLTSSGSVRGSARAGGPSLEKLDRDAGPDPARTRRRPPCWRRSRWRRAGSELDALGLELGVGRADIVHVERDV